jgi:hypothetical protein
MVMQTFQSPNIPHTPATIIRDELDFLDSGNHVTNTSEFASDMTPCKRLAPHPPHVSPSTPSHSVSSSSSAGDVSEEDFIKKIGKTEHRLAELDGSHFPEPLLTENPGRFVLFPIQDNDVSEYTRVL